MKEPMPKRQPGDGQVAVFRPYNGKVSILVTTDGREQSILMGEYNAWRVFLLMAFILDVKLPAHVGKGLDL